MSSPPAFHRHAQARSDQHHARPRGSRASPLSRAPHLQQCPEASCSTSRRATLRPRFQPGPIGARRARRERAPGLLAERRLRLQSEHLRLSHNVRRRALQPSKRERASRPTAVLTSLVTAGRGPVGSGQLELLVGSPARWPFASPATRGPAQERGSTPRNCTAASPPRRARFEHRGSPAAMTSTERISTRLRWRAG